MEDISTSSALVAQANDNFNSTTNVLDILNLDNNKNVLVLPNTCTFFTHQIDPNEVIISPILISPRSNQGDDCEMIDIEVVNVPNNNNQVSKYMHDYTPLTPPMSPKNTIAQIVERAKVFVVKVSR